MVVVGLLGVGVPSASGAVTGTDWTIQTSATDNDWYSVTYGNGLFVAVAWTGTGNRVMTSGGLIPPTPSTPTASAGSAAATVSVAAGSGPGGTATTYTVLASPGDATCTVTNALGGSCTVTGLVNGTSYTFTATASNTYGTSAASAASAAVTPVAPVAPVTPAAPVTPTTSATPATPTGVRWSRSRLTTRAVTATFVASAGTTYRISATRLAEARVAARAVRTVRGSCTVATQKATTELVATCAIRLQRAGTWRVSITPLQAGVEGAAATKRITVSVPVPARPVVPARRPESVTG